MSSPSSSRPHSKRASRITVEYHRPSRESIAEYNQLLSQATIHAAQAASYQDPFVPARQAPPPPGPSPLLATAPTTPKRSESLKRVDSTRSTASTATLTASLPTRLPPPSNSNSTSSPSRVLTKNRPRKHSLPTSSSSSPLAQPPASAPSLPTTTPTNNSSNYNTITGNTSSNTSAFVGSGSYLPKPPQSPAPFSDYTIPALDFSDHNTPMSVPPRPSRANTGTLDGIFPTQGALAQRRLSQPAPGASYEQQFYADPHEALPSAYGTSGTTTPPSAYTASPSMSSFSSQGTIASRQRSGTSGTKGKKGMLGFMPNFLGSTKRIEISTPYDPVHLTHVGFNSSTGEFTGLPKEWQQLLQDSGISKSDQEKNPQAVMEIVKFYQEGHGDWDKIGFGAGGTGTGAQSPPIGAPSPEIDFSNPVSLIQYTRFSRPISAHEGDGVGMDAC